MRQLLRSFLTLFLVAATPLMAVALTGIDWTSSPPQSGEVVGDEAHVSGEGTHPLAVIDNPGITSDSYLVRGSVRYENVEGPGYLEMWSYFADGSAYFSRTLDDEGPLAALDGSSPGREFQLPFYLNGAAPPDRLEINVVLPRGGDVWVGPLTFEGIGGSASWWTPEQGGLIGALAGTLLGLAGALVGFLASRGKHAQMVMTILKAGFVLGIVALAAGMAALVSGQPGHVWGLLLVIGGVEALLSGTLIPNLSRRFAEAELHRIHALDSSSH